VLASFERCGGYEELRISIDTYRGRRYINVRIWYQAEDGSFRPTKRGVTIRENEIEKAIKALRLAKAKATKSESTVQEH